MLRNLEQNLKRGDIAFCHISKKGVVIEERICPEKSI